MVMENLSMQFIRPSLIYFLTFRTARVRFLSKALVLLMLYISITLSLLGMRKSASLGSVPAY